MSASPTKNKSVDVCIAKFYDSIQVGGIDEGFPVVETREAIFGRWLNTSVSKSFQIPTTRHTVWCIHPTLCMSSNCDAVLTPRGWGSGFTLTELKMSTGPNTRQTRKKGGNGKNITAWRTYIWEHPRGGERRVAQSGGVRRETTISLPFFHPLFSSLF